MRYLDRYIGRHVVVGVLLALSVLVALFTFITFVDDLGDIGRGSYTLATSLEYVLLTVPRRTFQLFPLAALVGSLAGLGVLAGSSELTVVRASGVSLARITLAVMRAGALLMVAAILIGEVVAPACERLAQEQRALAMSGNTASRLGSGVWLREGTSFINIQQVLPDKQLGNVYIYEFDEHHRLQVATLAKSARYENGKWVLNDVHQSVITDHGVTERTMPRTVWGSLLAPDVVKLVAAEPDSMSVPALFHYIGFLEKNDLNTARYEIALWSKLAYPVATLVMIFLAIPLVLGRLSPVGIGQRILVGTLAGIAFHILQESSTHLGIVYGFSPALSALAPTLLFLAIGVRLMARVR